MFSLLGDYAIPCSSHLTDAVPGFHAGGLKHRSAPHWPSFTRALLVQSWRMRKSGSFPHSVLISLHCPCLYQMFRTSILTVCKHFITNYTCPKCVVVGFDITESCFMIRSQQVSREAELDVWTSANKRQKGNFKKKKKKNHKIWGKLLKISNITWKETRKLGFSRLPKMSKVVRYILPQ